MSKPTLMFKIRRKSDGLFSSGGTWPSFTKKGKVWKRRGDLTSHINLLRGEQLHTYKRDCEIVVLEVVESETETMDIVEYIEQREQDRRKQEEDRERLRQERLKQERYRQFKELEKEFGGE